MQGKVAVISGGTSGIGLPIARRFLKEGAYVFIFGRRQEASDESSFMTGSDMVVDGGVSNV